MLRGKYCVLCVRYVLLLFKLKDRTEGKGIDVAGITWKVLSIMC